MTLVICRGPLRLVIQAIYAWNGWSIENQRVVIAAGPAADMLYFGGFNEQALDLLDIERLTGKSSLEPYLGRAKEILAGYAAQVKSITTLLHGWTKDQLKRPSEYRGCRMPKGCC